MRISHKTVPRARTLIAVLVVVSAALLPAMAATAAPNGNHGAVAQFEGNEINLARGWGEAQACLVWQEGGVIECFRTEAEMDARIAELGIEESSGGGGGVVAASSTCSGYLRLYDGTYYTGAVLYLSARFQWLNLSAYGFDQKTSSFKIGPCSAYFADLKFGGGAWYPTYLTEAYDWGPTMVGSWNNDVSSVYIT